MWFCALHLKGHGFTNYNEIIHNMSLDYITGTG